MLPERIKQDDRNKICITVSGTIIILLICFVYIPRPDLLSESKIWEGVRKGFWKRMIPAII